MRRGIAIAIAGYSLAGCSSLSWDAFKATPPTVQVQLESVPQGADARTSLGPGCKTPCTVDVSAPDSGFSVKRIVAVCGDALYLKNGDVYLNGRKLSEPYLAPDTPTFTNSPVPTNTPLPTNTSTATRTSTSTSTVTSTSTSTSTSTNTRPIIPGNNSQPPMSR